MAKPTERACLREGASELAEGSPLNRSCIYTGPRFSTSNCTISDSIPHGLDFPGMQDHRRGSEVVLDGRDRRTTRTWVMETAVGLWGAEWGSPGSPGLRGLSGTAADLDDCDDTPPWQPDSGRGWQTVPVVQFLSRKRI